MLVAFAVVLAFLVAFAGIVVVAVDRYRDQQRSEERAERREELEEDLDELQDRAVIDAPDELPTMPTGPSAPAVSVLPVVPSGPAAEPGPDGRVPVDAGGGVSWSMRGKPEIEDTKVPDATGSLIASRIWSTLLEGSGPYEFDLAATYQLEGRSYDLDAGLAGVVQNTAGAERVGSVGSVTIAGQPGRMMVVTIRDGELVTVARYAVARFGDRVLLVATGIESDDPSVGAQPFADLVASVRAP